MPERIAAPIVLRVAGVADFVLACVCIATPILRSTLGQMATIGFATVLLAGSGIMFLLAKRMEQRASAPQR
jgi:hypothetical protein